MTNLSKTAQKIIFLLTNLMLATVPFAFTGINEELFEFNKIILVYSFTVLIVGLWITRMVIQKKIIFHKSLLDLPLLFFIISQILSTIFSIHPHTSIFGYYTRFHGGLFSTITYCLLFWAVVSNLNRKQIKMLLLTVALTALGVSLYAIPEKLGVSPSCIILRKKFDTSCWIQDVRSRVFATFGQPNWLAAYLSMSLPLTVYFALHPIKIVLVKKTPTILKQILQKTFQTRFWFIAALLILLALLFTQSRSGILGVGIGLGVFTIAQIILSHSHRSTQEATGNNSLRNIILAMILTTLTIGISYSSSLGSLINSMSLNHFSGQNSLLEHTSLEISDQGILITPSENIRLVVWRGAIKIWQRYPLFGSGPETFAYSYYLDRPYEHNLLSEWDHLYNKAHNEILNMMATTGIVGTSTYLLLMGTGFFLVFRLLHKYRNDKRETSLVLAIASGLVALNITNFFGFSTVMVSVLWMIFLAYLVAIDCPKENNLKKSAIFTKKKLFYTKSNLLQSLILLCLLLIVGHLLLSLASIWQADRLFVKGKTLIQASVYQTGIDYLQKAILLSPQEALFYDELANAYASVALEFLELDDQDSAREFAILAIKTSDKTLELNPRHLNFYQTRASIFSKLALVDPSYLNQALQTLQDAQKLSPSHPKLVYHQARIELSMGARKQALISMQQAIQMKPNYHEARYRLGQVFEENGECLLAKEQYQYILDNIIPNDLNLNNKLAEMECSQ